MFSIDRWQEIFDTLRRNKLRTALTSLSVAWGIFMLVMLLGFGTGLQNAVEHNFRDDAVNSLWIRSGKTAMPHAGLPLGRDIRFNNDDFDQIRDTVDGVEHITGRYGIRGDLVVYGNKKTSFDIRACHPGHLYLENTEMIKGRFINELDLTERRKVAAIGVPVAEFLFGKGVEPLGKWIQISGIQYQVVGVFEDSGGEGEMRKIYIPIATAQVAYGEPERVHTLMFTMGDVDVARSKAIEREVRNLLSDQHKFSPEDKRAVRIRNNVERFERITAIFGGINLVVWIVGFGTILAGIVGVSNIMLISVKERTKEIGIRKALGATPVSIVGQIVQEAIFLTGVSGYLGLLAGVSILELIRQHLPENDFVRDPQIDLTVALVATALLVMAGALAGFFPAQRAARVDPVVALRDE